MVVFVCTFSFVQGCSDAGICSIGHAFNTDEEKVKNYIEIVTIFGAGEADVTYVLPYVSYIRKFTDRFALSTKVTFSSASGNFGTRAALGDAFVIGNYNFAKKNNKHSSALLG